MSESFPKYPKIKYLGHKDTEGYLCDPNAIVSIQEKIDGANFRVLLDGERVVFGSRRVEFWNEDNIARDFKPAVEVFKAHLEADKKNSVDAIPSYPKMVLYMEYGKQHSITYENLPVLVGLDVLVFDENWFFLPPPQARAVFTALGIETAPVIFEGFLRDAPELSPNLIPTSRYYAGPAEGIVVKDYSNQHFIKIVGNDFKEVKQEVWGKPKRNRSTEEALTMKYATEPRINKKIMDLELNGFEVEMKLMKHLPKLVWMDIWDEHWADIAESNLTIDIKRFRKHVAGRCQIILKRVVYDRGMAQRAKTINSQTI